MDYKDRIIRFLATQHCQQICGRTIRAMQAIKGVPGLGDSSGLDSAWEQICVQVQWEKSFSWDAYVDSMMAVIDYEVSELPRESKEAIWFQTDAGFYWVCHDGNAGEQQEFVPYCEETISTHILYEYVTRAADEWSNPKIRAYLERAMASD